MGLMSIIGITYSLNLELVVLPVSVREREAAPPEREEAWRNAKGQGSTGGGDAARSLE